jgi:hypothetical protein
VVTVADLEALIFGDLDPEGGADFLAGSARPTLL